MTTRNSSTFQGIFHLTPGNKRPNGKFLGFPYLWTRISPAYSHLILLPQDMSAGDLLAFGVAQARINDLRTCLVIGAGTCCYFDATGNPEVSEDIPSGGYLACNKLKPYVNVPISDELSSRTKQIDGLLRKQSGSLFGDVTKGGHTASPEELKRFEGRQSNGVPEGLERCLVCGSWKGQCLDPNPVFKNKVMTAHCACDNRNRCAGCGGLLYEYKLNANYFDESDGMIWHVPGFCAFEHKCPDRASLTI